MCGVQLCLLAHTLALAVLLCCALLGGNLAAAAEVLHQTIDASTLTHAFRQPLAALLERLSTRGTFPFGAARLPALVAFSTCVCAGGAAVMLCLEAFHAILAAEPLEASSSASMAMALVCALTAVSRCGVSWPASHNSSVTDALELQGHSSCVTSRLLTLFTLAIIDRSSHMQQADSMPRLLQALLRQRYAWGAIFLFGVAIHRAVHRVMGLARIFLQTTPRKVRSQLELRVDRAKALQGVLGITEHRFWALDEESIVGSLRAIVAWNADSTKVVKEMQRLFQDVVSHVTVQIERDETTSILEASLRKPDSWLPHDLIDRTL